MPNHLVGLDHVVYRHWQSGKCNPGRRLTTEKPEDGSDTGCYTLVKWLLRGDAFYKFVIGKLGCNLVSQIDSRDRQRFSRRTDITAAAPMAGTSQTANRPDSSGCCWSRSTVAASACETSRNFPRISVRSGRWEAIHVRKAISRCRLPRPWNRKGQPGPRRR